MGRPAVLSIRFVEATRTPDKSIQSVVVGESRISTFRHEGYLTVTLGGSLKSALSRAISSPFISPSCSQRPVAHRELVPLLERLLEVGAEAAVVALAEARFLGIVGPVQVGHRVALVAHHEAHRVPGQVEVLLVAGPVARLAELAGAVGTDVVSLLRRLLGDHGRRAEVKPGVLGSPSSLTGAITGTTSDANSTIVPLGSE